MHEVQAPPQVSVRLSSFLEKVAITFVGTVALAFESEREAEGIIPGDLRCEIVVAAVEGILVVGIGVVELDLGPGVGSDVVVEVGVGRELRGERQLEPTRVVYHEAGCSSSSRLARPWR